MGAFEPVSAAVDFPKLEEAILERWRAKRVFERSIEARAGCPEWVFYEGPPTANSRPGVHHVWARSFKDLFPRFHTMRGRRVERKGGWDCHGLPVEVEVEKELGFSGKEEIRRYGVEEFNRRCRESVHRYVSEFAALTERIGMWIDTEGAYWTLTNDYIESVWWLFRQMWDRGLIDEGYRVSPYCGRCGTALSTHEVAQGYRDVTEDSVYVRFPVEGADFDLLAWTTTPWTLVSNVAAAVSPDIDYVRVRSAPRDLVLAAARVTAVLGEDAEIVARMSGEELVGLRYGRPFPILPLPSPPRVVGASFVTTEDGTGIVHLAPAFGEVDREVAEAEG
ncbi:MAG: class I tRNA ligase family protein, partial [Acidimicrobiia bacterium]